MQPTLDCLEQLDRDQRLHDLEGAFRVDELADPDAVMQDGWTILRPGCALGTTVASGVELAGDARLRLAFAGHLEDRPDDLDLGRTRR